MKTILSLLLTFVSLTSVAQSPVQIKASKYSLSENEAAKLSEVLTDFKAFNFKGKDIISKIDKKYQKFSFDLEGIEDFPSEATFVDSKLITEKTISTAGKNKIAVNHYKGYDLRKNEGFVLSAFQNSIAGTYQSPSGKVWNFYPLNFILGGNYPSDIIIFFEPKAVISQGEQTCTMVETENRIKSSLKNLRVSSGSLDYCRIVNAAIECDNEFVTYYSSTYAELIMEAYFNGAVYAYSTQMNITIQVGFEHTWTSSDPYVETSVFLDALAEFRDWWNSNRTAVSRDFAYLFSMRSFSGAVGVCLS